MLADHILRGAQFLDMTYQQMDETLPDNEKDRIKQESIDKIITTMDTLDLKFRQRYQDYYRNLKPNNTFFMSYLRYRGDLGLLQAELDQKYRGDIKMMLEDYKSKYPSL